jgi:Zn-dependent protease
VRFGASAGFGVGALSIAAEIAFVNLFLGLFNLIPFPPLDGFTALRAALPWHLASGLNSFEQRLRAMGPTALILFLLAFSYIFAGPFYSLVRWIFGLLLGAGI